VSRPVSNDEYVELQRFYVRQARAIDGGDARAWAHTFTPDGSFTSPSAGGRIAGTEELERFAQAYARDERQYRHWSGQLEAQWEDDGSVSVSRYGMLLATEPGGRPQLLRTSMHRDRLVRDDNGWRIVSRVIEPDAALVTIYGLSGR
jgi:3-phenylpropionate/cinnamic acid dioxygenase small subunit